jgi:hypothetical protein
MSEAGASLTYEGPIDIAPLGGGVTLARYGDAGPPIADTLNQAIAQLYERVTGRPPNHDDVRARIVVTLLSETDHQ